MNSTTRGVAVAVALLMMVAATGSAQVASENSVVLAFQRAADNYAFQHRRLERRGEPMVEARQGELFTPAVHIEWPAATWSCSTRTRAGSSTFCPVRC